MVVVSGASQDALSVSRLREHVTFPANEGVRATKSDDTINKPSIALPGTVEKIIPPVYPSDTEKAQIGVEGADDFYREIRVENALQDKNGKIVALKPCAHVEVTIEADQAATRPKQAS
jgi:hypothetical protein